MIHKITILVVAMLLSLSSVATAQYYSEYDEYLYPERAKTISMDLKGASLTDVLKMFSQQSEMNFIASSQVANQTINVYLDQVSVEEALERILSASNLTYEIQQGSNIFIVKPLNRPDLEVITRVYPLKYATIPSSKLNSTLSEFSGGGSSGGSDGGIVKAIEAVLSPNGKIIEDARTNSLVITDIPNQFELIENTVKRLDVRIPQILIEVEMLDVSKDTSELLGVKFGNTPLTLSAGSKETSFPFDSDSVGEPSYTSGNLSFEGLNLFVQFLRSNSDTKSLARPRILTLNNETAEINISTNEAIGITSSVTGADAGTEATTEAERADTGVVLTVTPQANTATGEITLAIEPKVIQATAASGFVGSDQFKNTEERGSKSILRVKDGDTIILGGLLRSEVSDTRTRLPFLGKIPVVGAAFRHKTTSEEQRELIIFITPQILSEEVKARSPLPPEPRHIVREQDFSQPLNIEAIEKELSFFEKNF